MTLTGDVLRHQLARLATQEVRHRAASGLNEEGERTFSGVWTTHMARVRRPTMRELDLVSDIDTKSWVATIPNATVEMATDDQLEMPSGDVRPIMAVTSVRVPESNEQWALRVMVK